jgi:hypothetical protein
MNLLNDCYAPITENIGFLEADFARVAEADALWRASLGGYVGRSLSGPMPGLLNALLPLTGPLLRYIWIRTTEPWTAYFDNFVLGSDPFPPISHLAQRMGVRGLTIGCRTGTSKRGAAISFSLFGWERTEWLNCIRTVSAIEDEGRWEWTATGNVQPFEDENKYQQRRVRDRLTVGMLADYCESLGIRPFDESFYGSEGHLVENRNIRGPVRSETLAEARASHGLDL